MGERPAHEEDNMKCLHCRGAMRRSTGTDTTWRSMPYQPGSVASAASRFSRNGRWTPSRARFEPLMSRLDSLPRMLRSHGMSPRPV